MNACFMLLCLKNWITGKPKTQFLGIPLLHGDDMSEAEVGKTICLLLHSQTLPYGHLLNTDTSFLRTVFLVPWEKKALKFSLNSTRTLSMAPSVSVLKEFDCASISGEVVYK